MARVVVLGVLLAGLTALVGWEYAPALRGGFVYEDFHMTDVCDETFQMNLHGRKATIASWCWQRAQGHAPIAFHAVNLGLHLVVTVLVGLLVWSVTDDPAAVLLSALFFGVNAVNVETVAYLSERSELIAAIGVLGACLAVLHARWVWVGPLLLLGWWGKETAAVAVMLVPLCLWYQWRWRFWAWIAAAGGAVLGLSIIAKTGAWWAGAPSPGAWALLQTTAFVRVLKVSVLPFGQTVDYHYALVPLALRWFAVATLIAAAVWVWRSQQRLLLLGAAWTVCAAAPRLIVPTPYSVFPEHQFYLPLVGMALVLASVLEGARA